MNKKSGTLMTFSERITNLKFEKVGKDEGIDNSSITNIVQDREGYLWLASQGGLYQFNGKGTVVYRTDPFDINNLSNNLIQSLYYDEKINVLWLGTYQGISKFEIDTKTFKNYTVEKNGLSNSVIVAISQDQYGNMWFGTMEGMNKLDKNTEKLETFEIEGNVVRSICLDSKNRLLVGTYEGLLYFDPFKNAFIKADVALPSKSVMKVLELDQGFITIGMWDGGVVTLDMDFKILNHIVLDDNRVYTMLKTSDATLWVGTWGGGLFAILDDEIIRFKGEGKPDDIGNPIVYTLFEDNLGTLWVGTNGGGTYKVHPQTRAYLKYAHDPLKPDSLSKGRVNRVYRDLKDNLWIAVYNSGINRLDPNTGAMIKYSTQNKGRHGLIHDQVLDFMDYGNKLLIASGSGVGYYDPIEDAFKHLDLLPENNTVYKLYIDKNHHLWVGSYLTGAYLFDEDFTLIKHIKNDGKLDGLGNNQIYDILCDQKRRVWIGTNNGLYQYNEETLSLRNFVRKDGDRTSLGSNNIRTLMEDHDGNIWIGTLGGGVARFDEHTECFESITEKEGLAGNEVVSLLESKNNEIWVATLNGLSVVDIETGGIVTLTVENGLGGLEYTGVGMMDGDGSLYFAGEHGVDVIPSSHELEPQDMPPVYITNVTMKQHSVEPNVRILNHRNYVFNYNENDISFDYEALDYMKQSTLQYYHQLKPFDKDWISTGNRNYTSYSNLEPGSYEFSVKVKNLDGIFSETASLFFTIKLPWFKTKAAYGLYIGIVAASVYGIVKIREGHLLSKKNKELGQINNMLNQAVGELEALSTTDALTGIYNRRYFDSMFDNYINLARRGQDHISLIMIDVDDFKAINDLEGHLFGDRFLKVLASTIQGLLIRSTDFCARFGGDEFAVVLYDTDEAGARAIAARIQEKALKLPVQNGNELVKVKASLSIGIYSAIPTQGCTVQCYLKRADEMMYVSKRRGKDQITSTTNKDA
ncbi:MAG: diguanylate cyclase [Clostridia bacterium]|nr:diguanylate cyclase [Clostridia bacterium]